MQRESCFSSPCFHTTLKLVTSFKVIYTIIFNFSPIHLQGLEVLKLQSKLDKLEKYYDYGANLMHLHLSGAEEVILVMKDALSDEKKEKEELESFGKTTQSLQSSHQLL